MPVPAAGAPADVSTISIGVVLPVSRLARSTEFAPRATSAKLTTPLPGTSDVTSTLVQLFRPNAADDAVAIAAAVGALLYEMLDSFQVLSRTSCTETPTLDPDVAYKRSVARVTTSASAPVSKRRYPRSVGDWSAFNALARP